MSENETTIAVFGIVIILVIMYVVLLVAMFLLDTAINWVYAKILKLPIQKFKEACYFTGFTWLIAIIANFPAIGLSLLFSNYYTNPTINPGISLLLIGTKILLTATVLPIAVVFFTKWYCRSSWQNAIIFTIASIITNAIVVYAIGFLIVFIGIIGRFVTA